MHKKHPLLIFLVTLLISTSASYANLCPNELDPPPPHSLSNLQETTSLHELSRIDVALPLPDGTKLVAGQLSNNYFSWPTLKNIQAIIKVFPNGALDPSFGDVVQGHKKDRTLIGPVPDQPPNFIPFRVRESYEANHTVDLALLPDGKILALVAMAFDKPLSDDEDQPFAPFRYVLFKLNADGTYDKNFRQGTILFQHFENKRHRLHRIVTRMIVHPTTNRLYLLTHLTHKDSNGSPHGGKIHEFDLNETEVNEVVEDPFLLSNVVRDGNFELPAEYYFNDLVPTNDRGELLAVGVLNSNPINLSTPIKPIALVVARITPDPPKSNIVGVIGPIQATELPLQENGLPVLHNSKVLRIIPTTEGHRTIYQIVSYQENQSALDNPSPVLVFKMTRNVRVWPLPPRLNP